MRRHGHVLRSGSVVQRWAEDGGAHQPGETSLGDLYGSEAILSGTVAQSSAEVRPPCPDRAVPADRESVDLAAVDRRNVGPESAHLAVESEDRAALLDSLILCKFLRGVFSDLFAESAEILQLVTGWDVTAAELHETAQRIVTGKKRFNILAGWTPAEDTLPERMLQQALPDDPRAHLSAARLQALVKAYNLARGWSEEGWLPAESAHD